MRPSSLVRLAPLLALVLLVHCKETKSNEPPLGPVIDLSVTTHTFTAVAGAADPAPIEVQVTNGGSGTLEGLDGAVTYPPGKPGGWLHHSLKQSTAPATIDLSVSTGTLAPGQYNGTLIIESSNAEASATVEVTFVVEPPPPSPEIAVSETSHQFAATAGGANPAPAVIQITNAGPGTLSGLGASIRHAASEPVGWLAVSFNQATAPSSLTVTPTTGALPAGTYHATIDVLSPVASNSPVHVDITFQVNPPASPSIVLTPTSRSFAAVAGGADPAQQTVAVTNGGGGTLSGLGGNTTYQAGQPTGWLSTAISGTTAPATLFLTPHTGSLAPGIYSAVVSITSAAAGNSPQTITVAFRVDPNPATPVIGVQTSVNFTATQGGGNPPEQVLQVTNAGGGTLTGMNGSITYASGQPTGWLLASLGTNTAPTTLTVRATTGSRTAGTYQATMTLTGTGASPRTITVTFTVLEPNPAIGLGATSINFTATQGGASPAPQTVQVTNSGGGTLTGLTATEVPAATWLTASLSATTAPAMLTLQATTGSLAAGTYSTTVNVGSAVAGNSPQTITVTFQVGTGLTAPVLQSPTVSGTTAVLTWSFTWPGGLGSSGDGYQVERSNSPTTGFAQIYSVSTHDTPFTLSVTSLAAGTHYFRVRALTTQGTSPYSAVQSATIGGPSEITIYASEDNTLITGSADASLANTIFRTGGIEVGCNFSILPFGEEYVCGEALMRFPVQAQIAGRTIVSAELRLYARGIAPDQGTSFRLGAVARTWSTTNVTFNSFHNGAEVYLSNQVERPAPTTATLPYTFDVTAIVRNWANGSFVNNGLLLWDTVAAFPPLSLLRSVSFDSADSFADPVERPQLIIRLQ